MASPSLHIAMLPWFSMGHITPFLQLSNKLAERGHRISFFIPKHIHATMQHLNHHPNLISLNPICVPHNDCGLPHVAETTSEVPSSPASLLMTPMALSEKDIEVHLLELKPNIVFFDHAYWIPVPRLTRCLDIKSLLYYVISPSSLAFDFSYSYPLSISKGCCNIITEHDLMLHSHEPKILAGSGKLEYGKGTICIERCTNSLTQSYATGLKGCREIEGAYVEYYRRHVLLAGHVIPKATASHLGENWAEWLGKFEAGSVIYCAFDSECTLEPCQFQELLLGLELSGMPFLAALKPPKGFECVESAFPQGFKERVQGRGVVRGGWIPHQQFILEHPSVGCFITRCGSGSLPEALVNKCQLVLLPNHGEMVINARVVGNSLKVGVEVEKLKAIKMVCLPKKVCAKL
ncbi:Anthocyanidin 3-O-glucoside 2''-O-glucosyltransferase [Spatholobus suberectus]|nr:Anthocyanidin 3-O-glucoside 2''-O-glucosyltransferase [Spatholobus suberectus]